MDGRGLEFYVIAQTEIQSKAPAGMVIVLKIGPQQLVLQGGDRISEALLLEERQAEVVCLKRGDRRGERWNQRGLSGSRERGCDTGTGSRTYGIVEY